MLVFVCLYVCVCTCVRACVCVHTCRLMPIESRANLWASHSETQFCSRQGFLLPWSSLGQNGLPVRLWDPPVSRSPVLGLQACYKARHFYMGSRDQTQVLMFAKQVLTKWKFLFYVHQCFGLHVCLSGSCDLSSGCSELNLNPLKTS